MRKTQKAREWFYELTRQTHRLRFVATGGLLKNALKADNELTDDDLIRTGNDDETTETDDRRLNFTWYKFKGGYLYNQTITSSVFGFGFCSAGCAFRI